MASYIEPVDLKAAIRAASGGEVDKVQEYALVDVREEDVFAASHLLTASNMPLSLIELLVGRAVPRLSTTIFLCDDANGDAERAAIALETMGYQDVKIVRGGVQEAQVAGFKLFSGLGVPSKAFGELVEIVKETPHVDPDQLCELLKAEDAMLIDCRPPEEFRQMSIPGAINIPGAELALRFDDYVSSPDKKIVINCAGRTRSIIGTQSLRNAGIPNPVYALRNGTMGWHLAGYSLNSGKSSDLRALSMTGRQKARERAEKLAEHFGIREIGHAELARFMSESAVKTLFVIDVRTREEFLKRSLPGAIWVPGGQLVQETDRTIAVRNSRIVLLDDLRLRAVMTASWLAQMGWRNVSVFAELEGFEGKLGDHSAKPSIVTRDDALEASASAVERLLTEEDAALFDVALSTFFNRGHIPGATYILRSELAAHLAAVPKERPVIVTSEDGSLACMACRDIVRVLGRRAYYLSGGTSAWAASGRVLSTERTPESAMAKDVWIEAYDHEDPADREREMKRYLEWEVNLVRQLEHEPSASFEIR